MSIPRNLFVNVYPPFAGQVGTAYGSQEIADQMAASSRLACVEIDILRGTATATDICGEPGSLIEVATE